MPRKKFSVSRKGRKMSLEARQKMSDSGRGKNKTKEHNENVSQALKGRVFSEEHKKNLSISLRKVIHKPEWGISSGKARMKKVLCINNGVEYESTKHAARELGVLSDSISRVCNGKYAHTKGYIFRYIQNENS